MTTIWERRYALRTRQMGGSTIRELLKLTVQEDIISFAGGLPAPELFPIAELQAATERVLGRQGRSALQYSTTEGYEPLRRTIVEKMARYGIQATPENVLITSGSQQALDLIGKILINPGDLILTERPTYLGALQAWRGYQAEFTGVPMDEQGLRIDPLEEALCAGPKFMYVLPNFHNPAGVTLSLDRRLALIRMADHYGVPIIEDDPYGDLRYDGEHLAPLVVLDGAQRVVEGAASNGHGYFQGNVIYLSTFSKTLAPGLRLGWMVAPRDVIQRCVMAKQGMDLHSSSFVQMVAYETIQNGFLQSHVRRLRQVYRERRDIMLDAMERCFPPGVTWTRPEGGLFLFVTLPAGMDSEALLSRAIASKVAFVPGVAFYPDGSGRNTLRLTFAGVQPAQIREGIQRLGAVLAEERSRLADAPAG